MSYYCVRIFSGFLLHFFRLNTTPHWIFWGNSRNLFLPCAKLAFISINFGFLFLCMCACGFYVSYAADISLHLTQSWFNKRKELCCISTILHFPPQPQTSATSRSRNFERKITLWFLVVFVGIIWIPIAFWTINMQMAENLGREVLKTIRERFTTPTFLTW